METLKITLKELSDNIADIIREHPLVKYLYINEIPTNNIVYQNIYFLFTSIELYENYSVAHFKLIYNDKLNDKKDNEIDILSEGTTVIKDIFNKIKNSNYRVSQTGRLLFAKHENADINVSVSGEIGIIFQISNNCNKF